MNRLSDRTLAILAQRGILHTTEQGHTETYEQMVHRVVTELAWAGPTFWNDPDTHALRLRRQLQPLMLEHKVTLGSPLLANLGREDIGNCTLFSAVGFPIDIVMDGEHIVNQSEILETFEFFACRNVGMGFDLTGKNPTAVLNFLDKLATRYEQIGRRPISLMAVKKATDPWAKTFCDAKTKRGSLTHFNLSLIWEDRWLEAALHGQGEYSGSRPTVDFADIFDTAVRTAYCTGEPGFIHMERLEAVSPMNEIARFCTTPPCADLGFQAGAVAHFGYINLAQYVCKGHVDYDGIASAAGILTEALDNAVEISIQQLPFTSKIHQFLGNQRRISIGGCGLADAFEILGISYGSPESVYVTENICSVIAYASKNKSVVLAMRHGSCEEVDRCHDLSEWKESASIRQIDLHAALGRYIAQPTDQVPANKWRELWHMAWQLRALRNISTTSWPPTSIGSIILNCSPGIEPRLGQRLSIQNQLNILAAVSRFVDGAVSKTIVVPYETSLQTFRKIFVGAAEDPAIRAIAAFREGTR